MPSWKRTRNFSWTDALWLSTLCFLSSFAWRPETSDVDMVAVFNCCVACECSWLSVLTRTSTRCLCSSRSCVMCRSWVVITHWLSLVSSSSLPVSSNSFVVSSQLLLCVREQVIQLNHFQFYSSISFFLLFDRVPRLCQLSLYCKINSIFYLVLPEDLVAFSLSHRHTSSARLSLSVSG